MYEVKTFESLMQRKLNLIAPGYDKREGSVIYDAMAPNSAEMAQAYINMEWMFRQMFGDTAEREYLMKIAKDTRGLRPYEATKAVLKGKFNIPVDIGKRFSLDGLYYAVIEVVDERTHTYKLQCETSGEEGNRHLGKILPVEYINGLESAEIIELLVAGEDEESTEDFRKRWRQSFSSLSFGGNKADYKDKIKALDGVGGVKVFRSVNEQGEKTGGHVKCVVLSADFKTPSESLIETIQTLLDPEVNAGEGEGLAPIGHEVHVSSVIGTVIHVSTAITYQMDYAFEDVKSYIEDAVDSYFQELNKAWEDSSRLTVRIAQIESRLLDIEGILDVKGTMLNGAEENIILGEEAIAVRGEIHG